MKGKFWSEGRLAFYSLSGWKTGWERGCRDANGVEELDLRYAEPWKDDTGEQRDISDEDALTIIEDFREWSPLSKGRCRFVLPSGQVIEI